MYEISRKLFKLVLCTIGIAVFITYVFPNTVSTTNASPAYKHNAIVSVNKVKQKHAEYKISNDGIELIKQYETCKLDAYHISGEKYNTIGWGHLLDEKGEGNIKHISQYKADKLFKEDIEWVNDAVNRLLNDINENYEFSQGMIDGMCSMIYNCGEDGVKNTPFYKRLQNCRFKNGEINKSDYEFALAAVKFSKTSKPGLVKRRVDEYNMMRS